MADEDVSVRYGANIEDLQEGVESVKEQIDGLGESFKSLAEIAGIAIGVDAFKEWVESSAELGERMTGLAAMTGATVPQISELSAVSKLTGTNFEGLVMAAERMQLRLAGAGRDSSAVGQALHALGISAKEFATVPIPEQLDKMADAFSKFADGPTKTALAMALLGRSGAEMIPYLDRGKEGLDELREVAERTGAVMSGEMAESFAHTQEDINELSLAWQGLSNKIFAVVNGPIDQAIKAIAKMMESLKPAELREDIAQFVEQVGTLTTEIVTFAVQAVGAIKELIAVVNSLAAVSKEQEPIAFMSTGSESGDSAMQDQIHGLKQLNDAMHGEGLSLTETLAHIDQETQDRVRSIKETLASFTTATADSVRKGSGELNNLPGGRASHAQTSDVPAPAKPSVPQMDIGDAGNAAKEAEQAIEATYAREVAEAEEAAKKQQSYLDELLKTHQITMASWLSQTKDALGQEEAAIDDAADKATSSAALTSNQRQAIWDKEEKSLAAISEKMVQDQAKAAEATSAEWQKAFTTINGAFDSQISGLLRGTTTWANAFKNVLASLTESVIKFFVNWGLQQAETVVKNIALGQTEVAAHVAGDTTKAAADQASAASGIAAMLANAEQAIAIDIKQIIAGVTAFLAPIFGPAAVPMGAAAGAGIGMMDIGAYNLPEDQLALLHKNELVMPAAQAGAFRNMLEGRGPSGGGPVGGGHTFNFTPQITAMDGASVARVLSQFAPQFAKTVVGQLNMQPSLRPSY